jgi:hypothetical protein
MSTGNLTLLLHFSKAGILQWCGRASQLRELNYNLQKSGLDNYAIRALKYCPVQP